MPKGRNPWKTKEKLESFTFFIIVSFFHVSIPLNKAFVDVPAIVKFKHPYQRKENLVTKIMNL